ncbi:MAG: PilZ domain-containing protein [Candidatus Fibromonas sp.]|jgi:c-di-GMP-binding flagellar brake protein YcgR|nr:PilZ domain-containing protein [Candidatus Fibromonas sp.]
MTSDSLNAYEKFAESLRRAMERNYSIEAIFLVAVVISLVVIIIVLYEIHRTNRVARESLYLAWKIFDSRAAHLKLSEDNIYLLKEILYESGLQDPSSIMKSPHVFEASLEKYYEIEKIESISSEKLTGIRELRRRLGFLPLSKEMAFTSTRQFDLGERCMVQIPDKGPVIYKGMSLVRSVGEKYWSITSPDRSKVPANTQIYVNLTRAGDAEYVFKAQVIRDYDGELFLNHVNKLDRTQQRNWVRIDVNIPVEIIEISPGNTIGDIFAGKIIDMSGGGFGMTLPIKLSNGTRLLLNFELPGQGKVTRLPVKVVRVSGFTHSVAFDGDVHLTQEHIIQFIFEQQRQNSQTRQT